MVRMCRNVKSRPAGIFPVRLSKSGIGLQMPGGSAPAA
jgi:hypothetical protein